MKRRFRDRAWIRSLTKHNNARKHMRGHHERWSDAGLLSLGLKELLRVKLLRRGISVKTHSVVIDTRTGEFSAVVLDRLGRTEIKGKVSI